jgi:hypothetical protein
MTSSQTRTATFTITDARYIGAKIGTDLRMLHNVYGKPSLTVIPDYVEEAALLLKDGYLNTVDYGFKDGTAWKLRLRYTATLGGHLLNDRPGTLPMSAAVAGLSFYSYLTYSAKFWSLQASVQAPVKASLPISRTGADEPTAGNGTFATGHGYGRNGVGVTRSVYNAYE